MLITKNRILNLDLYIGRLATHRFHVVGDLEEVATARLSTLGFPGDLADGDTFLPAAVGPVSRFNANGSWLVYRDRPKELRYIRTVFWRWRTWDGHEHQDFKDQTRACYPREPIAPPSVQLIYRLPEDGRRITTTAPLENVPERRDHNKHVINLFLELFGSCVLAGEDLTIPPLTSLRTMNWRFLPPGKHPWETLNKHLELKLKATGAGTHLVIMDRQKTLESYVPDERFVGEAGFSDYIAYVFKTRGLVVLESIQRDNALYVFGRNWEQCSRLTKAEIIGGQLHSKRIIHSTGWKAELHKLLGGNPAIAAE